jgi:hypothetical protein
MNSMTRSQGLMTLSPSVLLMNRPNPGVSQSQARPDNTRQGLAAGDLASGKELQG